MLIRERWIAIGLLTVIGTAGRQGYSDKGGKTDRDEPHSLPRKTSTIR